MKCKRCGCNEIVMNEKEHWVCHDCGSSDYEFEFGEWGYNDNEDFEE